MLNYRCFASHPLRRSALAAAVGAMSLALFAPAAQADVTFTFGTGTIGGGPDNNILFNSGAQTGTTVTGTTNGGGVNISFTSNQVLRAQGGQADIDTTVIGNAITQDITIAVATPSFGLKTIEFLPSPVAGAPADFFYVTAIDQFGTTFDSRTFNGGLLYEGAPGNRVLGITANGQLIRSLVFHVGPNSSFDNLLQFRVDAQPLSTANPIPEPSEWLAMGMAAASVGGLMVRARRRKSIAA